MCLDDDQVEDMTGRWENKRMLDIERDILAQLEMSVESGEWMTVRKLFPSLQAVDVIRQSISLKDKDDGEFGTFKFFYDEGTKVQDGPLLHNACGESPKPSDNSFQFVKR